jgi:hypothetical protein
MKEITSEYILETSDKQTFKIHIHTHSTKYIITCGGMKEVCIMVTVYRKVSLDEKEIAHIDGIIYESMCNLQGDMKSGQGTIDMVKGMLSFVCKKFPYIKAFTFKDTSYISCAYKVNVPLAPLYICKYNQTWYEKHFDAKPFTSISDAKVTQCKNKLDERITLPFELFWNEIVANNLKLFKRVKSDDLKRMLQECYKHANTHRDFIISVDSQYDCIVFQIWLKRYFYSILGISFDDDGQLWKIDKMDHNWRVLSKKKTIEVKHGGSKMQERHFGVLGTYFQVFEN